MGTRQEGTTVVGSMQLPQEAARLWGDPIKRQEILDMHERGDSLLDMVEALGLTPALDADGLRSVVTNLSADEIRAIRDVFVAEAAQAGGRGGANFPVDCRIENPGNAVRVTTVPPSSAAIAPVVRIDAE